MLVSGELDLRRKEEEHDGNDVGSSSGYHIANSLVLDRISYQRGYRQSVKLLPSDEHGTHGSLRPR